MTDTNSTNDVLDFTEDNSKLPTGLNVLTILTIIGSILAIVSSFWSFFTAKSSYEKTKEMIDSGKMDDAPSWAKGFMSPEMLEMQRKMVENRMPIMILSVVAAVLCLYGAMEMRKRKKQGYMLWLIGEILPVITSVIFLGMASMQGFGLLMMLFPLAFIIMYTVNRKELIY